MLEYQKHIDNLTEQIYDTTLDRGSWTDVLARITDFVGGQACALVSKDPVNKSGVIQYFCNVDPHYIRLYAETYSKFDPLATLPPIGQVVSIPDLVPYDDFRQGRFYQEYLRPQGLTDNAIVALAKSESCADLLIIKPGGMVGDEMRSRMALMAPHVRRALLIGKAINLKQSEAATFADTLSGLSAGIFLVDDVGRIVHANAAGQDMLYVGDFLRSIGGRLAARNAQVNQTLREALAAASGGAGIGAKAIAFPLTAHDGERHIAHLLPLTSGARRNIGTAYGATAALFVRKVALESPSAPEALGGIYKLTPTEQRVLSSIVQTGSVPETAQALGIADTTVKTHLHRGVFAKIGVNRQADLVRLVAALDLITPRALGSGRKPQ
jgi:DNA-binding CsgD family transcriptional regulator/PAS domain-containing protein